MDFFSAQDQARGKTRWLVLYFGLALVAITLAVYGVVVLAFGSKTGVPTVAEGRIESPWQVLPWQPDILLICGLCVLAVVGLGSLVKTAQLRGGGGVVARSLGGRRIGSGSTDPAERRLRNVVEEMAIASGTPVPEVYVLDNESAINAFAAGFTPGDAAVAVTRGTLDQLSRDELQGVIAHEFSHILNGDMRINIRLLGLLFGIFMLSIVGRGLMRASFFSGGGRGGGRGRGSGGAIVVLGIGLLLIGLIGVLFGRLIQSAVSRQREYLADASAVQFTRNPSGIARALKRIGARSGSRVEHPHASDTAHLFFANALKSGFGGALATHPPLEKRIRAIEPGWDGRFQVDSAAPVQPQSIPADRGSAAAQASGRAEEFLRTAGTLGAASIAHAQSSREHFESEFDETERDTLGARALLFALVLDEEEAVRARQLDWLEQEVGTETAHMAGQFSRKVLRIASGKRLDLLEWALPRLESLDGEELDTLVRRLRHLVEFDQVLSLHEFALLRIVRRYRRRRFGGGTGPGRLIHRGAGLAQDFNLLLSAVVYAGGVRKEQAQELFRLASSQAPAFAPRVHLLPESAVTAGSLDQALDSLERATFALRRQLLGACTQAAIHDRELTSGEANLVRAIAVTLDCPIPPFLQPVSAEGDGAGDSPDDPERNPAPDVS